MVELLEQNQENIHKLCELYFVKQLKVFSSVIQESDFSQASDLDCGIGGLFDFLACLKMSQIFQFYIHLLVIKWFIQMKENHARVF